MSIHAAAVWFADGGVKVNNGRNLTRQPAETWYNASTPMKLRKSTLKGKGFAHAGNLQAWFAVHHSQAGRVRRFWAHHRVHRPHLCPHILVLHWEQREPNVLALICNPRAGSAVP